MTKCCCHGYQSITLDPDTVKRYSSLHFVAHGGYTFKNEFCPFFNNNYIFKENLTLFIVALTFGDFW